MCPRCGTRDLNGIFEYDRHAGPYRPSNLIRNHEVTLGLFGEPRWNRAETISISFFLGAILMVDRVH